MGVSRKVTDATRAIMRGASILGPGGERSLTGIFRKY
jgi:hypothetical protein